MTPDTANTIFASEDPGAEDDGEGLPLLRIVLGYITTLALTLASAVAISGFGPEVVTTIAGI